MRVWFCLVCWVFRLVGLVERGLQVFAMKNEGLLPSKTFMSSDLVIFWMSKWNVSSEKLIITTDGGKATSDFSNSAWHSVLRRQKCQCANKSHRNNKVCGHANSKQKDTKWYKYPRHPYALHLENQRFQSACRGDRPMKSTSPVVRS